MELTEAVLVINTIYTRWYFQIIKTIWKETIGESATLAYAGRLPEALCNDPDIVEFISSERQHIFYPRMDMDDLNIIIDILHKADIYKKQICYILNVETWKLNNKGIVPLVFSNPILPSQSE